MGFIDGAKNLGRSLINATLVFGMLRGGVKYKNEIVDVFNAGKDRIENPKGPGETRTGYGYQIKPDEAVKIREETKGKEMVLVFRGYEQTMNDISNNLLENLDPEKYQVYVITTPHKRAFKEALSGYGHAAHPREGDLGADTLRTINTLMLANHGVLLYENGKRTKKGLLLGRTMDDGMKDDKGSVIYEGQTSEYNDFEKYFSLDGQLTILSCRRGSVGFDLAKELGVSYQATNTKYDVLTHKLDMSERYVHADEPIFLIDERGCVILNEDSFCVAKLPDGSKCIMTKSEANHALVGATILSTRPIEVAKK